MTTPITSRQEAQADLHHLRTGTEYRADTRFGSTIGEYIGMESPHGDRAILLKHAAGCTSIEIADVTSIRKVA